VSLLHAGLGYAYRGWRVFPLHGIVNRRCTCARRDCSSPGKHPLVRRGLHEATTDEAVIERWWRCWRSANIGLATGTASGIVVIDIDLGRRPNAASGSAADEAEVQDQDRTETSVFLSLGRLLDKGLPRTLTGLTGGGGVHLIYRARSDSALRNHAGRLPGISGDLPGVDLRADGGYIVAPPSIHRNGRSYEWLDPHQEIALAPRWLKEPERRVVPPRREPANFTGDGTAYGRAALQGALTSLRQAPVGQRNHTLNRVGFAIAQLVAGGELLQTPARTSLLATALTIGLNEAESRQTLDSAFAAGLRQPRYAPHRLP